MKQWVLNIMICVFGLVIPHANCLFSTPLYIIICALSVFTIFFHIIS